MAISIGMYELTARTRQFLSPPWLAYSIGLASFAFAVGFLAFVFRWIKLDPASPSQSLHWLGSYFGFCAICMLLLSRRLYGNPVIPTKTA
jgi:hypothetical protein